MSLLELTACPFALVRKLQYIEGPDAPPLVVLTSPEVGIVPDREVLLAEPGAHCYYKRALPYILHVYFNI